MRKRTEAVHAGERRDHVAGVNTPVVAASTYAYPELAGKPSPYIYSRYDNPTLQMVEQRVAALEGAAGALVFASGMAAIGAVCMDLLRPGMTVAMQRGVYGGTAAFLRDEMVPMGIHVVEFGLDEELPACDVVWMESITNPLLRVADLPVWAARAKEHGAALVVDATFATPMLQRPLELGADLVVHSGTKYLGGHTDLTAGMVCHQGQADGLWTRRRNWGPVLDPMAGYLLGRGIKTLPLRMQRHGRNAEALARHLADRDDVIVHHPSLPDHPDHAVAQRLLDGPCGMLSIDLGGKDAAVRFRRRTRLITPAASLGGVESLLSLPIETSHAYASAEERAGAGITDGLVRISVGIEDIEDLIADVDQALS